MKNLLLGVLLKAGSVVLSELGQQLLKESSNKKNDKKKCSKK